MNILQNFSIRSRFNIITVTVLILILFILTFFIFTLNKTSKYNSYNDDINQLQMDYLNMRRYEQHFLLRYNEDANFFITGENIYIKKLHTTSSDITKILLKLSQHSITKNLNLTDIINDIETIQNNYISTFKELTLKTFKKGSFTTGIIGNLKSSGQNSYKTANASVKNKIYKMIDYSDSYLLTTDEKYYSSFLMEYEKFIKTPIIINDSIVEGTNNNPTKLLKSLSGFKNNFILLVKINKELGLTYKDGLEGKLRELKFMPLDDLVNAVNKNIVEIEKKLSINLYVFFGLMALLIFVVFWRFSYSIIIPLNKLREFIEPLSLGVLPKEDVVIGGDNEISKIAKSVSSLIIGLKKTTNFAIAVGQGTYDNEYKPLSNKDTLGNALIEMQENLVYSKKEGSTRKEEDDIRTWTNVGLTKFNDILRQSQGNITEMSIVLISELVKFINANQGGIFVFNDDEDDSYLELTASYAYGHDKKKQKTIYPGEGIVGTVAIEKETVYMTEIPETYITITSGLGSSSPRSLLIVPMIIEGEVIGVIELASFNKLKDYEIEFVETLAENIASSLSITKINQKTENLFEQSKRQTELMKVQEEEMRQNYEELQQVQEDLTSNATEMSSILDAIDSSSTVFYIDPKGEISSVNQQFLLLTDISQDKVVGISHKDFFTSNNEEYKLFWEMLLSGENVQKDEYLKIGDVEFWFSVVYRPILDINRVILYVFSVGTNLTASKKLELELKENIVEINKAKKETEKKQYILENTNEMLKANEKTLNSAVETAMRQRKELAKKIAEIAEEDALTTSLLDGINQTNITINLNLEGNITSVNRSFKKLFNYDNAGILKSNLKVILSEKFILSKDYSNLWENLKEGVHVTNTFNFISKDKQNVFIQGTFTALKDIKGKTKKIFFVGFNTSDLILKSEELKARETELQFQIEDMETLQKESLKQQEELTLKTFEILEKEAETKSRFDGINQTNIVIEFDNNRKITLANKKFTKIFGYTEEEALKQNCQFIVPEQVLKTAKFKKVWEDLENGKTVTDTFNFLNKERQKIFIHGTFTPIKDRSENVKYIVLIGFDITELVSKSEELKARETELEFQLEDLQELRNKAKK